MKKRITLLFAAALSMSTLAFAQPEAGTFSITPRIGLSMTNLLDDNGQAVQSYYYRPFSGMIGEDEFLLYHGAQSQILTDVKYRMGFTGSVDLQWHRSERWAFVTGVGYSLQGCRFDKEYHRPSLTNTFYAGYFDCDVKNVRINLHYLTVPVMAKLYVGQGFAFNGGLQVGWLWKSYMKHHWDYVLGMSGDFYLGSGFDEFKQTGKTVWPRYGSEDDGLVSSFQY